MQISLYPPSKNGASMTYDYDNRLKTVGAGTSFVYDWQGQRVKKVTSTSTTVYIGKLYEVKDGAPTKHIFAGNRRIASRTGTEVYYYHPDHLGGLHIATNSAGARVQTALYYPFGENRYNSGSTDLPHKFTGQEKDETGFYYYGARYYDPVTARFITPDSIVQAPMDPQSLNRYSYCRNNPVMYTDPTGHFWWFFGMLAAGAAFGATMAAINGQDPGMGALTGAITALGFMGAHFATAGMDVTQAAMVHAGVGAATGAINAAITGSDPGFAALTGGVSGGISRYVGGQLPGNFGAQIGGRMLTGAVSGGLTAVIVGRDFSQGAFNGAWTAGFGTIFNDFGIITGTLLCTAASFGIAWMGTQIASWAMGNPSAASYEINPETDFAKNYRMSNVTSELTLAAGALTVSAEALVKKRKGSSLRLTV